jgi:hypothetical protein
MHTHARTRTCTREHARIPAYVQIHTHALHACMHVPCFTHTHTRAHAHTRAYANRVR